MAVLKSAYVQSNEVVKATDINLGFDAQITNVAKLMQTILESTQDFVINGVVSEYSGGGMNISIAPIFGVNYASGQPFVETQTTEPISIGEGYSVDRIDTIEVYGELVNTVEEQRAFIDFDTKEKTLRTVETQKELQLKVVVKHNPNDGTVYSTAPATTEGRVKIAEIFVPADATDISECDIYNITSDVSGVQNENWTTEKTKTYNIGYISDVNSRFREEHNQDGTHKNGVIGKNQLNLTGNDGNQFTAKNLYVGDTVSLNGETYATTTAVSDMIKTVAIKVTDIFNEYLKYGKFNFKGEIAASKVVNENVLTNAIKIGAAGDGTAYCKIGDETIFTITEDKTIRMASGYTATNTLDIVTKAVTDALQTTINTHTTQIAYILNNIDPTSASNRVLSKFTAGATLQAATTANITLSGEQTIDGVPITAGNLVLVKNQTDKKNNGIYQVTAGEWSRGIYTSASEIGMKFFTISSGTTNGGHIFISVKDEFTIGTDDIEFIDTYITSKNIPNTIPIRNSNGVFESGKASNNYNNPTNEVVNMKFLADVLYPVGFVYTQYPGELSPSDMHLYGTWTNISNKFAGLFFRCEGGNAESFNKVLTKSSYNSSNKTISFSVAHGLSVGARLMNLSDYQQVDVIGIVDAYTVTLSENFTNWSSLTTVLILQSDLIKSHNHIFSGNNGTTGKESHSHTHGFDHVHNMAHSHKPGTYEIQGTFNGWLSNGAWYPTADGAFSVEQSVNSKTGGANWVFSEGAAQIKLDAKDGNGFTGMSDGAMQEGAYKDYTSYAKDGSTHESVSYTGTEVTSHNHSFTPSGTISSTGGTESRPLNATIRLWKRTA